MPQNGTVTWPMNSKNMQPQHHPGKGNPYHSMAAHQCAGQDNNAIDNTYCQGPRYSGGAAVYMSGLQFTGQDLSVHWPGLQYTGWHLCALTRRWCTGQDHSVLVRTVVLIRTTVPWPGSLSTGQDCGALARTTVPWSGPCVLTMTVVH